MIIQTDGFVIHKELHPFQQHVYDLCCYSEVYPDRYFSCGYHVSTPDEEALAHFLPQLRKHVENDPYFFQN